MKIRQDKYKLSQSSIAKINEDFMDIKLDLKLMASNNKINIGCSILGYVKDSFNEPIKRAKVKLLDSQYNLLTYSFTDEKGMYHIETVPYSENYSVIVTSMGKLPSKSEFFKLKKEEKKILNFILNEGEVLNFGVISGVIEDKNNFNHVVGSVIWLYKIINNEKKLEAITYSDKKGEFLFSKLSPGIYNIVIFNISYFSEEIVKEVKLGEISKVKVYLQYKSYLYKSSISGIITDESNKIISDAIVILYKLDNNKVIPVSFTTTNSKGLYNFINIPKGNYIIKSKKVEIISSNYNNITFTLVEDNTIESSNYKIFDIALGTASGSAIIDKNTNFIMGIGGENNGAVSMTFKLNHMGLYNLAIQYIAPDVNRHLNIDVNGSNIGTNILPKTNGSKVSDVKVFTVPNSIELNLNNTIKYYGDGINNAPYLGKMVLYLSTYIFNISEGQLANGAVLDEDSKLINWLGGETNGNISIIINVKDRGIYNLAFKYLSFDGSSPIKVNINGINTGSIYVPLATEGWSITDAKLYTLPHTVNLNLGENKIEFLGDGKSYAPSLGNIYITLKTVINSSTPTVPKESIMTPGSAIYTYNVINGTLTEDAQISSLTNFVTKLGGINNGSVSIKLNLDNGGLYNLAIQYIASDANRPLKIEVNGINIGTNILPKTNGNNVSDAKVFTLPNKIELSLNNTIKFYGDGINSCPDLGKVFLALAIYIFKLAEGKLSNGAILDEDSKLINWLGGETNGSVFITVNVKDAGIYQLAVKYLSFDGQSPIKIDINEVNTGSIYIPPATEGWSIVDAKLYTLPHTINLNLGENKIKFYGEGKSFAPSLGDVYITLKTIINLSTPTVPKESTSTLPVEATKEALYTYNAIKGILTGGAEINSANNLVTKLGGENDGATTLTVFIDKEGIYNLFGIYIAPDFNSHLKIFINETSKNYSYELPMTRGETLIYSKIFIIVIELKEGNNTIKFHGNGKDLAPDLGPMVLFTNDFEEKEPVLQYY
ncbi:carboxypeptidase regulatory-like domain-containing protein, partial [Clostridium tarantellae]